MNKQLVLPVLLSLIIFGFGFPDSTLAVAGDPIPGIPIGLEGEPGLAGEPIPGVDIELGTNLGLMASSDLGVDNVGTLPTSPFYFLKEWKRGITRFFTFDSIAKAELELDITNQIAAEVLEVGKSNPDDAKALKNALQNFTNAQERLNARITTINGTSNVQGFAKLLEDVDEKTAKHAALLGQLDANTASSTAGIRSEGLAELVGDLVKRANENTLRTFTITVTPVNDAPSLKQKAADQIASASVAIHESEAKYKEVIFTADNWNAPQTVAVSNTDNDSAGVKVTVPKQTQGTTFGEKAKVGDSDDTNELDIFDRWGNSIAKAKEHLTEAKKAFAEGTYGEAYGLARSAEAIADGVRGTRDPDNQAAGKELINSREDKTSPSSSTTTSNQKFKVSENESPRSTDRAKAAPKATTTEKTEAAEPSGSSAGPASNYDRDN